MTEKTKKMIITIAGIAAVAVLVTVLVIAVFTRPGQETPEQTLPPTTVPTTVQTQPATTPQETLPPAVWNTLPELDATYEQWLAAAMVMAASMLYSDFQVEGIYAASATDTADRGSSQGAYIQILTEGESLLIHASPLDAERGDAGTTDISTAQLGFATFDTVDPAGVQLDAMEKLSMEDLNELMRYSLLVSIYSH